MKKTVYDFKAKDIKGNEVSLEQFKGKTLMIVNTASACGFTPQYEELQRIYKEYGPKGLEILAFPCNQFGHQEKGSNEEIAQFCNLRFNATFPLFEKIEVNGDNAHPLYQFLKDSLPGLLGSKQIKWNFTKFIVDSNGKPTKRYAPQAKPLDIIKEIEFMLK
ncbi:MAG: glutathione peroxidase [Bacteriovoracaceae bacterium]|nr:glutathione peroxidase [Bacteriovoracaceae bacterium]